MPAPASFRRRWTLDEVCVLIDDAPEAAPRYELVDGELLVTPSPAGPHGFAVAELLGELRAWLRVHPFGRALTSPFDVRLEPETLVQPDVFVVPLDEAKRLETEMPARSLVLVIEVLSPSTAYADRGPKRQLYQRHVPEYWIVDLDSRLVERWRPGDERPEILRESVEWRPPGSETVLVLDLPELFSLSGIAEA